jgi:hypothetical protein
MVSLSGARKTAVTIAPEALDFTRLIGAGETIG